jgi:hypothetical protein
MITAAARALASGDPLGALNRVALREDAPALALRGIAMAQLGDLGRARDLVRRAQRAFGPLEAVARARCVVAEAEIALVSRDLAGPLRGLAGARATLASHGDRVNVAHAAYLEVQWLILIGRIDAAERLLGTLDAASVPAALAATHHLAAASIAMRRVRARDARAALERAAHEAQRAGIPALRAEVDAACGVLATPAARVAGRAVLLDEVESILGSLALVVDACRLAVREGGRVVPLVSRPVLFTLVRALAEAWPGDVTREALVARAFRAKSADESYRARLRVEIGRLRAALRPLAQVEATKQGFVLVPRGAREVTVLARPVEEKHASVLALLADGESWSTSALALALNASQRNVQRALEALASQGKVRAVGRGRACRWMTPPDPAFATALLLPAPLPVD